MLGFWGILIVEAIAHKGVFEIAGEYDSIG